MKAQVKFNTQEYSCPIFYLKVDHNLAVSCLEINVNRKILFVREYTVA